MNPRDLVSAVTQQGHVVGYWRESGQLRQKRLSPAENCGFVKDLPRGLMEDTRVLGSRRDGDYHRIIWRGYNERKEWRETHPDVLVLEGDVSPVRRVMADYDYGVQTPEQVFGDLETDSRKSPSRAILGEARVLTYALAARDGREWQGYITEDTDEEEERLIRELLGVLEKFDQFIGWNMDGFDRPVLEARAARYNLYIPRRIHILDAMTTYIRMNKQVAESGEQKTSFALGSICQAEIGIGKNDFDSSKTYEAWAAGGEQLKDLLRYNAQDARLLVLLEKKKGYIDAFQTICKVCNIFPNSHGLKPTAQMDGFFLRLARKEGRRLASKVDREPTEGQFKGAYVMPPKRGGILKDVSVLDFSGMYPSILTTWNLSFDTLIPLGYNGPICTTPTTNLSTRTDVVGFVPRALVQFGKLRKDWKAKKSAAVPNSPEWREADGYQNAYKVLMNSLYGILGSIYSRFYSREIALAVTQTGEWLLKVVIAEAEKRGYFAEYADTDGAYLSGGTPAQIVEFARWLNEEHLPSLVTAAGCVTNAIAIEYQEMFSRIVFPVGDDNEPSAKRYCGRFAIYQGNVLPADKVITEIKGLEFKRGDGSRLGRAMQKEVVDLLMSGEEDVTVYESLVERWLRKVTVEPIDVDDIAISKSVKPIEEYKVRYRKNGEKMAYPAHVEVALELMRRGDNPGRVRYVVTDATTSPQTVIPIQDFKGDFDRHHTWNGACYPPTLRLLQSAFGDKRDWEYWKVRRPKKAKPGQLGLAL